MDPSRWLRRAAYTPLVVLGLYGVVLALICVPLLQREFLFLSRVNFPLFVDYDRPEDLGLAPFRTRNFYLNTSDGVTLGAWHILARSVYRSEEPFPPQRRLDDEAFERSFTQRPTILYFHGNAGTRATAYRVKTYSALANVLDCNVVAVDYRGFGDSTGSPNELGLIEDAQTAWTYVYNTASTHCSKDPAEDLILMGHSLGTGVVSGLAATLQASGISPRALVLVSPFASVRELLKLYKLFFVLPLLSPLKQFPALQEYLLGYFKYPFDSRTALANVTSPILIVNAANDLSIPTIHSSLLFDSLNTFNSSIERTEYPGWGLLSRFNRKSGCVTWLEAESGGHNKIGLTEGTIDLIGQVAGV